MPEGLIAEIQRDAINDDASVSSLLRKVKLAAAKLKLDDLASWVDLELNGYPNRDVPNYRRASGPVRWWNPYRGWQPLGGDATILNKLSEATFGDSVASIEAMVHDKTGSLISTFPPELLQILSDGMGINVAQAGVEISKAAAIGILDAVRTATLNWAIEMEKAGVHGENLSFSSAEQSSAQSASTVFHINSIGSFTGNLGVGNTSGDITTAPLNIERVRNLVSQVKAHAQTLTNEGVDGRELTRCLAAIEAQLQNKDPSLLRLALKRLQEVVVKASGGLVAHGVLAMLHQIVGTGVPNV